MAAAMAAAMGAAEANGDVCPLLGSRPCCSCARSPWNKLWTYMAKVGVRHLGRDRENAFFFCFFEFNHRHLAKVGVRHLGRDREKNVFLALTSQLTVVISVVISFEDSAEVAEVASQST